MIQKYQANIKLNTQPANEHTNTYVIIRIFQKQMNYETMLQFIQMQLTKLLFTQNEFNYLLRMNTF